MFKINSNMSATWKLQDNRFLTLHGRNRFILCLCQFYYIPLSGNHNISMGWLKLVTTKSMYMRISNIPRTLGFFGLSVS